MNTRRGALALPLALLLLLATTTDCFSDARFVDKTSQINITLPGGISTGIATFDYNADGHLELQVSYESTPAVFHKGKPIFNGFPQWTNKTSIVYPQNSRPSEGSLAPLPADYDNDGDIDLYVYSPNDGGNLLYRNNGDGTFTEVGASLGIRGSGIWDGPVAAWGDYDGDGWVDLVTDGGTLIKQILHNNGASGTASFSVVSGVLQGDSYVQVPEDFVWIDLDHDGDLDLFELNGDTTGSGASDVRINSGGSSPTLTCSTAAQWQDLRNLIGRSVAVAQIIDDQGGYAEFFTSGDIQSDLVKTTSTGSSYVRSLPTRGGHRPRCSH